MSLTPHHIACGTLADTAEWGPKVVAVRVLPKATFWPPDRFFEGMTTISHCRD